MKTVFTFIFTFLFCSQVVGQSFLPDGVEIMRQSQLDSFSILYPNCSDILGKVLIEGPVNNLLGLGQIKSIGGDVLIKLTNLINFKGLENIEELKGLSIINNLQLQNFDGLNRLTKIGSLGLLVSRLEKTPITEPI